MAKPFSITNKTISIYVDTVILYGNYQNLETPSSRRHELHSGETETDRLEDVHHWLGSLDTECTDSNRSVFEFGGIHVGIQQIS